MPEIKHTFSSGKMNKDLDERLVPNGEYRDALNVQVTTSESSDVGTIENILNNTSISIEPDAIFPGSKCVGVIDSEKDNKVYWFIAGAIVNQNDDIGEHPDKDMILEYDKDSGTISPVVVDIWRIKSTHDNVKSHDALTTTIVFNGNVRVYNGMVCNCRDEDGGYYLFKDNVVLSSDYDSGMDETTIIFRDSIKGFDTSSSTNIVFEFTAKNNKRLLNFSHFSKFDNYQPIITGINILEGFLLWTDNDSEPKKINIKNCKDGSNNNFHEHTKLIVRERDIDLSNNVTPLREEHITVIKKRPSHPPSLDMKSTDMTNSDALSFPISFENPDPLFINTLLPLHSIFTMRVTNASTIEALDWEVGDVLLLKEVEDGYNLNIWPVKEGYNVRAEIVSLGGPTGGYTTTVPPIVTEDYPNDFNSSGTAIVEVECKLLAIHQNTTMSTQPPVPVTTPPTPVSLSGDQLYAVSIEQPSDTLFQSKFPRFSYRYKYQDNEYSAFAPWSEIAFLPGRFDLHPTKGYNLGMENTLSSLNVKNFVPSDILENVIAVDLLYKEDKSPTVYIIDTVKYLDAIPSGTSMNYNPWNTPPFELIFTAPTLLYGTNQADVDTSEFNVVVGMKVYGSPNIPNNTYVTAVDPSGTITLSNVCTTANTEPVTYELEEVVANTKSKGVYQVKSETIFKTVSEDQTIRPWDNVPRKALCQEVIGNRIVYANYLQNYNMNTNKGEDYNAAFDVSISTYTSPNIPGFGVESLKSIRTYQIGMSYLDEYGRETPIFTDRSGSIKLPKSRADNYNKLKIKPKGAPPKFATHFKYYIKETSGEYYNMVMDRIYDAADGNVWLSFPSVDRNKVDIDTFLILKKGNGAFDFVEEEARYKILAIEEAAPDFIKTKKSMIALRNLSTSSLTSTSSEFNFTSPFSVISPENTQTLVVRNHLAGLPLQIKNLHEAPKLATEKILSVRFIDDSRNMQSNFYKAATVIQDMDNQSAPPSWDHTIFNFEEVFGEDTAFVWAGGSFEPNAEIEFWVEEVFNKPEFDGRFFVKVLNDAILNANLTRQMESDEEGMTVVAARDMYYIGPGKEGGGTLSDGSTLQYSSHVNGFETCSQSTKAGGAHAKFYSMTRQEVQKFWDTGTPPQITPLGAGMTTYEPWNQFLETNEASPGLGLWFIDAANHAGRALFDGSNSCVIEGNSSTCRWVTFGDPLADDPYTKQIHHFAPQQCNIDTASDPVHGLLDPGSPGYLSHNPSGSSGFNHGGQGAAPMVSGVKAHSYFYGRWNTGTRTYVEPRGLGIKTRSEGPYYPPNKRFTSNYHGLAMRPTADASVDISFLGTNDNAFRMTGSGTTSSGPLFMPNEQTFVSKLTVGNYITFDGDVTWHKIVGVKSAGTLNFAMGGPLTFASIWPTNAKWCGEHDFRCMSGSGIGWWKDSNESGGSEHRAWRRRTWRLYLETDVGNQEFTVFHPLTSPSTPPDTQNTITMKIGEKSTKSFEGTNEIDENPAIWETEPKEETDLDIYYEISPALHIEPKNWNGGLPLDLDGELSFPIGSTVTCLNCSSVEGLDINGLHAVITAVNGDRITLAGANADGLLDVSDGDLLSVVNARTGNTSTASVTASTGSLRWDVPAGSPPPTQFTNTDTITVGTAYFGTKEMSWFNCFSFANGVESDRIRDSFNLSTVDTGVKASTTLDVPYDEERREHGLIYSGLYNSATGLNKLNQFISAKGITKDLNPSHGSIQKLHARDTDLITLCEDKVLKILANKDAVYNADGNTQLTATAKVLGQTIPFTGEYGISQNPESFASESYRSYFTDKQRGAVLRLSRDGLTPISDYGMVNYFKDSLRNYDTLLGTWDDLKNEYNLTLKQEKEKTINNFPGYDNVTISYDERVRGWVSFKSFIPEQGVSVANDYYTFDEGHIWQHHIKNSGRNNFYGTQYNTSLTLLLNDIPSSVKSFKTLNYEGSQSHISQDIQDGEYYNLWPNVQGWAVDYITTDQQEGSLLEFIEKEGKWFNYIKGNTVETVADIKTDEFSFQGIGNSSPEVGGDFSYDCVEITGSLTTTYECQQVTGTGGEFTTMAACQAVCNVSESWNCVQGAVNTCEDPGNGTGTFATWALCAAACGLGGNWSIEIFDEADAD